MQDIQKFRCVSGGPAVGLNVAKFRRRTTCADNWTVTMFLSVAKPLSKNLFARNLVGPHRGGNALDLAISDAQRLTGGVITDGIGHVSRVARYLALGRDNRRTISGQTRGR